MLSLSIIEAIIIDNVNSTMLPHPPGQLALVNTKDTSITSLQNPSVVVALRFTNTEKFLDNPNTISPSLGSMPSQVENPAVPVKCLKMKLTLNNFSY